MCAPNGPRDFEVCCPEAIRWDKVIAHLSVKRNEGAIWTDDAVRMLVVRAMMPVEADMGQTCQCVIERKDSVAMKVGFRVGLFILKNEIVSHAVREMLQRRITV